MRSPRTLRGRLMLWSCAATLAALLVFAAAAYTFVYFEESAEQASKAKAKAAAKPHDDDDDDEDAAEDAGEQVLTALLIGAPFGIAFSLLAATVASRRAIAPIDRAVRTAAEISVDRFDRRMDVPELGHELRPLAEGVNALLDRLQRGYDALAAFSADASHELRTPLAAVCSELEIGLRRPRTPADWEASARTSLSELRRLTTVVDAMLRFAQADAGRHTDVTDLDLAEIVAEVGAIHGDLAERNGVLLRTDLGEAHVHVRGDGDLLATALANLVSNAVRLTPKGGEVRISIAATPERVSVHVDDTGPGLPPDRDSLFIPFSRRGKPGSTGIGLGLPITRRIAARHGGTVELGDRTGGGARFSLVLPRS